MNLSISFRHSLLVGVIALLLFGPLLGCGKLGPDKATVAGKVTFDGAPVAEGTIRFEPTDGGGQPAEVPIKDGNYTAEMTLGEKKVILQGFKLGPPGPDGVQPNVSIFPPAYNADSTIIRNATKDGSNSFDFDLKSSGELPASGP